MNSIIIKKISKAYPKKRDWLGRVTEVTHALNRVDMVLDEQKIYGLVGESGSGKSTLARILVGLEKPDHGWILLDDESRANGVSDKKAKKRSGRYQLLFQNPFTSLDPRFSIFEIFYEAMEPRKVSRLKALAEMKILLKEAALPEITLMKYPHQLSGGERQRVALLRALLAEPSLLVLDEPTSSLDVSVRQQVLELIRRLVTGRKIMVILISHDLAVVRQMAEYVFIIKNGMIVEEGKIEEVYQNPQDSYTKLLLQAADYSSKKSKVKSVHKPGSTGECCP